MIKHLTIYLILCSLPFSAFSQVTKVFWPIIKTSKNIVTNYEVNEYIDNVIISERMHASLFNESNRDFEAYLDKKTKIIESVFMKALKKMSFIRIAQELAIYESNRRFFRLSKSQIQDQIDRKIESALALNKSKNLSNLETIEHLVADLKEIGFPYSETETDLEIFKRWKERVKIQTIEKVREKEAISYICSLGNCSHETPIQILARRKSLLSKVFFRLNFDSINDLSKTDMFKFIFNDSYEFLNHQSNADAPDKRYIFIGKVVDQKVEFMAVNDWDITGVLEGFGYPRTDDLGRTSGLMLNYFVNGSEGSLSVELENWLFSQKVPGEDKYTQHVEEATSLRITSRQFKDEQGNRWVVMGFSANYRTQEASIHSWIQNAFHTLNSKSRAKNGIDRDGQDFFLEGIIGLGGKYSIVELPHVDISIKGEGVLIPTIGTIDRSRVTVSSSLDANIYGASREYPLFFASVFGNFSVLGNGNSESVLGAKVGIGFIVKNVYLQASIFVIRWDTDLDRNYEGGASWTTGIAISATFGRKKPKEEYFFI